MLMHVHVCVHVCVHVRVCVMVENNEGLKRYLCHMFGIIVEKEPGQQGGEGPVPLSFIQHLRGSWADRRPPDRHPSMTSAYLSVHLDCKYK